MSTRGVCDDSSSSSSTSYSSSLDSKRHNRNRPCGDWTLHGHDMDGHGRYVRLGCKRWQCQACGPKKAKRLQRGIIAAAQGNGLCRLLTLTLDPSRCQPDDSIAYIRECWNKFRTSLKRHNGGKKFSFITVVELQKSGYAHLHILIDRFIEQGWLSSNWQAVGGGKIVDIRRVDIHRIGPYLSKYLTKTMLLADFKKGQRRYTTSRGVTLFVKSNTGIWTLHKVSIECLYRLYRGLLNEVFHDAYGVLQWFEVSIPEIQALGFRDDDDEEDGEEVSSLHRAGV